MNREPSDGMSDDHLLVGADMSVACGVRAVTVQADLLPEWYRATRLWFYGALGLVAALTLLLR